MRRLLTAAALTALATTAALATNEVAVLHTGTILVSGPRGGSSGDNFFNVEGTVPGTTGGEFRSYGIARWDLAQLRTDLDTQYGVGNWTIDKVDVRMTQSNASFTATGNVQLFYTTDDATDIKTNAGGLTYPFFDPNDSTPDMPVVETDPLTEYTFVGVSTGFLDTISLYNNGDGAQRLALANDVASDAGAKLTIVYHDIDPFVAATWRGQVSAVPIMSPQLLVTARAITGNNPPISNAGADQTVTDVDQTLAETVFLDGSASLDTDGSITTYEWLENAAVIATGSNPSVSLGLGDHTITLRVTDNGSKTDLDTVFVRVNAGFIPPVADAGPNARYVDADNSGAETISLSGTGSSDPDGTISAYAWTERGVSVGSGATLNISAAVGTHTYRLTVTDDDAQTDSDVVTVEVRPANIITGDDFDALQTFVSRTIVPTPESQTEPGAPWSAGDGYRIFSRFTPPATQMSIPFTLLDDTISVFVTDNIGIVNENKVEDYWFGANDMLNTQNPSGTGSVTYVFNIAGYENLRLWIDLAAMGNWELTGGGAGEVADFHRWSHSVDGGAPVDVFVGLPDESLSQSYVLASGRTITIPDTADDPLVVDGIMLNNEFRTFSAAVAGTGSQLTLTLNSSNNSDEAYAYDNLLITGTQTGGGCPGGDECDVADINGDCQVGLTDLALLLANFGLGPVPPQDFADGDLNDDDIVNLTDLAMLLALFGTNCN